MPSLLTDDFPPRVEYSPSIPESLNSTINLALHQMRRMRSRWQRHGPGAPMLQPSWRFGMIPVAPIIAMILPWVTTCVPSSFRTSPITLCCADKATMGLAYRRLTHHASKHFRPSPSSLPIPWCKIQHRFRIAISRQRLCRMCAMISQLA